jgi:PIN domain nuclease of toxin-antitoxin system
LIVLDTHVWIWWLSEPEKLVPRARRAVATAAGNRSLYISAISAWKIAVLVSKGRLEFTSDAQDWIARSEALPFFHFVPVDNTIAVRSVRLPEPFHKDPADRIIVATAMILGAPVVTSDTKILRYSHVQSIWK